ncbi:MAG: DUF4290 domain-containing protein [Flavobacteriales bacterium]
MRYNSQRERLIIPEYGRHVQQMAHYLTTVEDRKKRNADAHYVIEVMGNLNTQLRDIPELKHKLWDQLFIMADFNLDVDSPYPKLTREEMLARPKRLAYPEKNRRYRFYGRNIQLMIDQAVTWKSGPKRDALVMIIANHMKKCFLAWNRGIVADGVIFGHLKQLSGGQIDLIDSDENRLDNHTYARKKRRNYNNKRKKY